MAGISVSGLGSGLDVQGIVKQLMSIEQQPLQSVQARKKEYNAQLSSYGQLKSAISTLQDKMKALASVDKFEVYSATSSNTDVLTAAASSAASKGTYKVHVEQLAEAEKLRSSGLTDAQNSFGNGSLTIALGADPGDGSNSFAINVDSSNNTLEGIRSAINSASGNPGVTASIVNDGTSKYLTLTSDKTGATNTITITAADDGTGASSLTAFENASMTQVNTAKDAKIYLEDKPPSAGGTGIEISSSSNTVTGAVEGVTLTLKKTSGYETDGTTPVFESVAVDRDTGAVTKSVQDFVDAYNSVRSKLSELRKGNLNGDNTLLSVESQLRGILNSPPSGLGTSLKYLSEIGIKTERDGSLSLDTTELSDALSSDFSGVAELFSNDNQGYAFRMEALAKSMTTYDGLIDAREDGLNSTIKSLEKQEEQWNYRLELTQQRYLSQFTALDSTLTQMQSTSSYLSQQLARMG